MLRPTSASCLAFLQYFAAFMAGNLSTWWTHKKYITLFDVYEFVYRRKEMVIMKSVRRLIELAGKVGIVLLGWHFISITCHPVLSLLCELYCTVGLNSKKTKEVFVVTNIAVFHTIFLSGECSGLNTPTSIVQHTNNHIFYENVCLRTEKGEGSSDTCTWC